MRRAHPRPAQGADRDPPTRRSPAVDAPRHGRRSVHGGPHGVGAPVGAQGRQSPHDAGSRGARGPHRRARAAVRRGSGAQRGAGGTTVDLSHRHSPEPRGLHRGGPRPVGQHRVGEPAHAVPDRGPALPAGIHGPRGLRQVRALEPRRARGRVRPPRQGIAGRSGPPRAPGLHRQVRAAVEHPGDDPAPRAPGRTRHRGPTGHDRRQDPRGPRRPRVVLGDARRARILSRGGLARRHAASGRHAPDRGRRLRPVVARSRHGRQPRTLDQGPGVRRSRGPGPAQPHPHARGALRGRLPLLRRRRGRHRRRGGARRRRSPHGRGGAGTRSAGSGAVLHGRVDGSDGGPARAHLPGAARGDRAAPPRARPAPPSPRRQP